MLQGPYSRAAKVLASEGFATVIRATLDALKNLHPNEKEPSIVQIISSQAYIFSEKMLLEQLNCFLNLQKLVLQKYFPNNFRLLYSVPLQISHKKF